MQHKHVSQQMLTKENGLGSLEMGIAWHDRFAIKVDLCQQSFLDLNEGCGHFESLVAEIEVEIGCDLVITTATGMQLARKGADFLGEKAFNVHMDIFISLRELTFALFYFGEESAQSPTYFLTLVETDDFAMAQHGGMSETTQNIVAIEFLVKGDGTCKALHGRMIAGLKAALPKFRHGKLLLSSR